MSLCCGSPFIAAAIFPCEYGSWSTHGDFHILQAIAARQEARVHPCCRYRVSSTGKCVAGVLHGQPAYYHSGISSRDTHWQGGAQGRSC